MPHTCGPIKKFTYRLKMSCEIDVNLGLGVNLIFTIIQPFPRTVNLLRKASEFVGIGMPNWLRWILNVPFASIPMALVMFESAWHEFMTVVKSVYIQNFCTWSMSLSKKGCDGIKCGGIFPGW